jgi:hypothetical protein
MSDRISPAAIARSSKAPTTSRGPIEKEQRPELSIFLVRDHGALLKIAGKARNALQYDIGNPLTASLPPKRRLQLLATARPQNRQHLLAMFSNP